MSIEGTPKKSELFQAQTTQFQINPSLAKKCHESAPDAIPVLFHGSKTTKLVIGRGHDATVKIGKSNKRVSREHVAIEHKPHGFEMTILSPNGALIDDIIFDQGEQVPIMEGTMIEIVGNKLVFQGSMEEVISISIQAAPTPVAIAATIVTTMETVNPVVKAFTVNEITATSSIEKSNNTNISSNIKASSIKPPPSTKPLTLEDEIIQVLVYTRKSTMTCTDISNRLQDQTLIDVSNALVGSSVIGCVKRLGKTADGSPKEDLYYYKPDLDPDQERKKRYSDVGRSARKCTMKDTQYFFRIPPKLTASNKIRKRTNFAKEQEEDEELKSSNSSDDVSDMEVYELFKDV